MESVLYDVSSNNGCSVEVATFMPARPLNKLHLMT